MFLTQRRLFILLLSFISVYLVLYVNISRWSLKSKKGEPREHHRGNSLNGIVLHLKKIVALGNLRPHSSSGELVALNEVSRNETNVPRIDRHIGQTLSTVMKHSSAVSAQNQSTEDTGNTGIAKEVRPHNIRPTPLHDWHFPFYLVDDVAREDSKVRIKSPHNFNLTINEPNRCLTEGGGRRHIFLLVLVVSVHKNVNVRNLVRGTWGSQTVVDGKQIVTMFLLGKSTDQIEQHLLEMESRKYRDILQEDFMDTYHNLTLKSMMGMKWAAKFCAHARYVMKTDDDMFVGYPSLVRYLSKATTPSDHFIVGHVINGAPMRHPASKWYAPKSVYPFDRYPLFCSGSGYVVSGDMTRLIYETSLFTPFLYLEDVFVGICVNKLGIVPVHHRNFNNHLIKYSYCVYREIFTTHMMSVSITDKYKLWKNIHAETTEPCAEALTFESIAY